MVNKKNKYLAAQIATQGPTKGQQRIARRVQQYDELMRRQQPLTKKDAAGVRKSPPTKQERKITRACQHQAKLVRKEVRQTNRGNIAALLDATKSSRPEAAPETAIMPEAETDYLFQFCGNVITAQSEDEATQAAIEASAAPFDQYRRVLFASCTAKGSKLKATAAVVCKKAAPGNNNDDSADGIWEEKLFGLDLPPSNSTQKSIEAGLRSIAEALALVATQLACARDEGISHNEDLYMRPKVTIFTDSQAVMDKVSRINFTARQLKSTPCIEKLITRSEYLRHLGVEIELRYSPCLQSEGTTRAKDASRRAAKSQGACKSVDGVDEGLQILIDSLEK